MKTKEEAQAFVDEVRAVCSKHGFVMFGTCEHEGIYGEITIEENTPGRHDGRGWIRRDLQLTNEVYSDLTVSGIGDVVESSND